MASKLFYSFCFVFSLVLYQADLISAEQTDIGCEETNGEARCNRWNERDVPFTDDHYFVSIRIQSPEPDIAQAEELAEPKCALMLFQYDILINGGEYCPGCKPGYAGCEVNDVLFGFDSEVKCKLVESWESYLGLMKHEFVCKCSIAGQSDIAYRCTKCLRQANKSK